ncbi:MAG: RsmD family RNA methyltransferase [Alphaproteobacteria bacterium]|nr:RsmD family RNA methyltransferase [Alphaproteobacteria bacterium]
MNSNLQIISGKWRGKKLHLPPNARPTQNKARIALFNMLDGILATSDCRLATIWDAFAGSGAFGIEFLSRGAQKAIFTDTDAESIKTIKKNLAGLDAARAAVALTDATGAIKKYGADADIIFIDPPYAHPELGARFIEKLSAAAKPGAIIVWEMEKDFAPAPLPENLKILKDKTYGRARFLIISN